MEYKKPCPKCRARGGDKSGDNFHYYGEGRGGFCFKCGHTELSDDEKERRGIGKFEWNETVEKEYMSKEPITEEEIKQVKSFTGESGKGSRKIRDDIYSFFKVRFEYNDQDGNVTKHYYPVTQDYKPSAYKIRVLPKSFTSIGKFGKNSDLFGQFKFKNSNSKTIVITSGEVDCMSAFQILEDYRKSKGWDEQTPCVSTVIGESGHAQIKHHYEWLNRFHKIVICYDNDDAGREALKGLVKVLPKGKMYVMDIPLKDTNKMLEEGMQKQWLNAFYNARPFTPDGVVPSSVLMTKIIEHANIPKIPLPRFMNELEDMMSGGIPLGVIVTISGATGQGKSTIVEEMVYYWLYHSPYKVGIVSLESDCAQYGRKILSRHIGKKIDLIRDNNEVLELLNSNEVQKKANELFNNDDGTPRFQLVEDRDGGIESIKSIINSLIISCDCKLLILDPLSDILDGYDIDQQAMFNKWMKGMVKSHGVTFVNVAHTRKTGVGQKAASQGANVTEEDIMGSSSTMKSSACNLLFSRNKEAEDETERNTIYMKMPKCRWSGRTGPAGQYYYDNDSHTLYNKKEYFLNKDEESF